MKICKKMIKCLTAVLAATCLFVGGIGVYAAKKTPDCFSTLGGDFSLQFPLAVSCRQSSELQSAAVQSGGSGQLTLFGIIPIKEIRLQAAERQRVSVLGSPFGVKIDCDGVMVVGLGDVPTEGGAVCPAELAGIKKGDRIVSLDGQPIYSNDELALWAADSRGQPMEVQLVRGDRRKTVKISSVKSSFDGSYKLGMWVRDSTAGIGTLTFFDSASGRLAGLGHGIYDVDTGQLVTMREGELVSAAIVGIKKGTSGAPGEICGVLNYEKSLGRLVANTEQGVYGVADRALGEQMELGLRQEVKTGAAKMLTTIDSGKPQYYDCEIRSVDYNPDNPTKNMEIIITDKRLINKTGGIVQGMSGSPIVQNGRLVGAVTHVLVGEPKKGYAIFAESMLETARSVEQLKEAG